MLRAGQQPCQNGLIWRPVLTTIGGAEMAVFLGFALCSALWGAYHQTEKPHVAVPAQLPPTQGHDRDMGTSPNTAAIYVRRSTFDADTDASLTLGSTL